jgi:hypothetical protein
MVLKVRNRESYKKVMCVYIRVNKIFCASLVGHSQTLSWHNLGSVVSDFYYFLLAFGRFKS